MEIRNDVADFLIRQGLARPDLLRVRVTKIGTPRNNDGPQALIAYEREVAWIGNLLLPLLVAG